MAMPQPCDLHQRSSYRDMSCVFVGPGRCGSPAIARSRLPDRLPGNGRLGFVERRGRGEDAIYFDQEGNGCTDPARHRYCTGRWRG
jgi:hypothetical protein